MASAHLTNTTDEEASHLLDSLFEYSSLAQAEQ